MRPFKQKPKCEECGHVHAGKNLGGICIGCPCTRVAVADLDDKGLQELADMGVEVPGFRPRKN